MNADDFMTVDEFAATIHVNRKTVYEAIRAGELPGVQRFGRRIRLYKPAVLAWFSSGQTPKKRKPTR